MTLNVQAGTLYDKERLERGQSTHNVSLLGKMILEAESELGAESKNRRPCDEAG
jgi:hypothetical protein